ncbi:hypothetical protein ACLOJK_036900 [Asimina triloba]
MMEEVVAADHAAVACHVVLRYLPSEIRKEDTVVHPFEGRLLQSARYRPPLLSVTASPRRCRIGDFWLGMKMGRRR